MDHLRQDVKFALRTLSRAPMLTAIAIATLALAIGANSAVFSLVNTVLIRPLPYVDPDRLVIVFENAHGSDHGNVSGHEYVAWRDQNRSFDALTLFNYAGFTLTGRGEPLSVNAQNVTAQFFDVMRQRPLLGRVFQKGDDRPGAPRVAILSHSIWKSRFGGDSAVIGQRALLDDVPYDIIGVMPARGDMDADLWVPMDIVGEAYKVGKHSNEVLGRLRSGATIQSAQADLAAVARRLEEQLPAANKGHGVHVASLYEEMVGDVRRPFYIALGAAAFVLLIACANVGHLLLTRAAARQKELAVRTALGADRGRLIRQLITEALLLSVVGGGLGLIVATWVTDLLPGLSAVRVPRLEELGTDWRVVGATAGLCVFAGVVCGLIPAWRASSPKLTLWLGDGARGSAGPGRRLASLLAISEVAIALMLLVGAGLTVKSFVNLVRIDPGFDPRNVVTVGLPLPGARYAGAEQQRAAVRDLVARLGSTPGVEAAGVSTTLPLSNCCNGMGITIEGRPAPAPGEETKARMTIVGGRYFDAMKIPLRRGRFFETSDARVSIPLIRWYPQQPAPPRFDEPQAAPAAVINETMAKLYWPSENAVGKRFRILFSPWVTVIGVVRDTRQATLTETPAPEMFLSDTQEPITAMTLVVRSAGDPATIIPAIREQIHALDSALPVGAIATMDRVVWNSIGRPRFNATLLAASGLIALVLAVIGVYGVISYGVARRTREIGIRRALGAQTRDVLRLVLGQAFGMIATGVLVGTAGALVLTRVLRSLLYGVTPTDPATFVVVALLLAGIALIASYLPGRRAVDVDPGIALRAE